MPFRKPATREAFVRGGVSLTALFVLLLIFVPTPTLITLLSGVAIGSLVGISVIFAPFLWEAFKPRGVYSGTQQMLLGIFLLWLVMIIRVLWNAFYRSMGSPEYLRDSFVLAISLYLLIISAFLQATAPDFGEKAFGTPDRRVIWIASGLGVLLGSAAMLFQLF